MMFSVLRRFIPPYKWYVALNMLFNVLSTILSLFSFATIIPVLQILFGIMGKRWDGTGPNSTTQRMREDIARYYNKYWTYPKQCETPDSAKKVEYGPYWR